MECACPSDPIRASKCFQKAFELDPRESMAAKRLAGGFADDGEWELVEVIAKRAIEGEGGLDSGFKEGAPGALPKNSWAWAAVGVVELVSVIDLGKISFKIWLIITSTDKIILQLYRHFR